jgi:error-prone DNA polymerase
MARDDQATYAMIGRSETLGCFQIESPGQRELVKKLAPRDVADLIVDISLFRPGPVNSDMIGPFLRTRHGLAEPRYPHEKLIKALEETGGVVVFHEQVLRVVDVMTGCGLAEADLVRRHLSKEGGPERTAPWFRAQALARGFDPVTVERVWQVVSAFGGFGFCKAHAAAFAIPVYQSAWLRRHHPAAFYAGVLTHDPGMYPKRVIIADARLSGVRVLPVDVNASAGDWTVASSSPARKLLESTGPLPALRLPGRRPQAPAASPPAIRCSLREIKGISDAEIARIVSGQPYTSLRDFWNRAGISRPVAERLVLIGAFDHLYVSGPAEAPNLRVPPGSPAAPSPSRRDLLARVGVLARQSNPARHGPPALDLFAGAGADVVDGMADLVPAGQLRDLDLTERVTVELEILGFEVSQHVLSFYADLLAGLGVVRSADLPACENGEMILVAGAKVATQTPAVRSGQRIIFASLDDAEGLVDLAFFESVQDRCAARLFASWLLVVRGKVRRVGAGPMAVTVNATECWDLPVLEEIRKSGGMDAVRVAMATSDDLERLPGHGSSPGSASPAGSGNPADFDEGTHPFVFANGFTLSPYAETGGPGGSIKHPPRTLWHASPGSTAAPEA